MYILRDDNKLAFPQESQVHYSKERKKCLGYSTKIFFNKHCTFTTESKKVIASTIKRHVLIIVRVKFLIIYTNISLLP